MTQMPHRTPTTPPPPATQSPAPLMVRVAHHAVKQVLGEDVAHQLLAEHPDFRESPDSAKRLEEAMMGRLGYVPQDQVPSADQGRVNAATSAPGVIARLADALTPGACVQLIVTRVSDEQLLVTVLHTPTPEEQATPPAPFQVRGNAQTLDNELTLALPVVTAARQDALQAAQAHAEQQRREVEARKAAASKAKAPTPSAKPTTGTLTVTVTNPDVLEDPDALSVTLSAPGQTDLPEVTPGEALDLKPGRYTVQVRGAGVQDSTHTADVKVGGATDLPVTLTPAPQSSLF
ncbi:hypothetical protein [Deinococcus sonorensis]|uniref:Uncharacterized protein n=1 Tax=Deinococcus sonorensis TaxID=309891 RepID=A0ABV8Y7Z3_9DEIO